MTDFDAHAYPLAWPVGWPRTPSHRRQSSAFKVTPSKAQQELIWEVQRLGGTNIVLSTDIQLRKDGLPRADAREPLDPGVAVYFRLGGKPKVFACDQYDRVWKNMRGLAKTIEALRGIDRWGASHMLERALSAFNALPAPRDWRRVMGFEPDARPTDQDIARQYRKLAAVHHPDTGGSVTEMAELNLARDDALRWLSEQ